MKCPNCGADMPEHSLYCEECGEDIHIVPDFETEVEENMMQTLQEIVQEISDKPVEDVAPDDAGEQTLFEEEEKPPDKLGKSVLVLGIVLILAAIGLAGWVASRHYHSLEYQVTKAQQFYEKEQYMQAIDYYNKALEITPDDIALKFSLAEIYFIQNRREEYEEILKEIIVAPNATMEELSGAYGKLIAIYRAREDYLSIHDLLMESGNELIINAYQDYIAREPEFSISEGFYTQVQPLKISSYGNGTIYYTINGGVPDKNSTVYTAPIVLDEGDYKIQAFFENEIGICSQVVSASYHITISQVPAPVVGTVSGDYEFPSYIEVLEDDEDIYYTSDGSDPTISSQEYTGPIPMPIGKSVYKFIRISEGRSSEITERTYNLEMHTLYLPKDAERDILQYAMDSGKIYDEAGHAPDTEAVYSYRYQYVININEIDDFYVISEIITDTEGISTKTGNHFAVNAYNGTIFKLQINGENNYTLVEIQG